MTDTDIDTDWDDDDPFEGFETAVELCLAEHPDGWTCLREPHVDGEHETRPGSVTSGYGFSWR